MRTLFASLTAVLAFSAPLLRGDDAAKNVAGNWRGTLDAGMAKLRVVFVIAPAAGGGLTATMYSPDQSPRGIPVDGVTANGTALKIEVKAIGGSYEGTLDATGKAASGRWTQKGQSLPLELTWGPTGDVMPTAEILSPADQAANQEAAQKVAGTWNGTLATSGPGLRLRVNITKTAAGAATGTMDSLDQGANGIPVSAITLKDGKVRFEARGIGGVYDGILAADSSTLSGQWHQGGQSLPLVLQKAKPE